MAIEGNESTGNTFGNVAKITFIVLFLIRKLFRHTRGGNPTRQTHLSTSVGTMSELSQR